MPKNPKPKDTHEETPVELLIGLGQFLYDKLYLLKSDVFATSLDEFASIIITTEVYLGEDFIRKLQMKFAVNSYTYTSWKAGKLCPRNKKDIFEFIQTEIDKQLTIAIDRDEI